jgi:hypothetical protein
MPPRNKQRCRRGQNVDEEDNSAGHGIATSYSDFLIVGGRLPSSGSHDRVSAQSGSLNKIIGTRTRQAYNSGPIFAHSSCT